MSAPSLGTFGLSSPYWSSDHGRYALGPRALAELETYLKNHYDDLGYNECVICHSVRQVLSLAQFNPQSLLHQVITRGLRCCHAQCQTRIHHGCLTRYTVNQERYICPSCRQDWSQPQNRDRMPHIGAEAFREGQDDRTMKRPQVASEGESDEEMDDTVEVEASQSQGKTTRSAQQRTKNPRAK